MGMWWAKTFIVQKDSKRTLCPTTSSHKHEQGDTDRSSTCLRYKKVRWPRQDESRRRELQSKLLIQPNRDVLTIRLQTPAWPNFPHNPINSRMTGRAHSPWWTLREHLKELASKGRRYHTHQNLHITMATWSQGYIKGHGPHFKGHAKLVCIISTQAQEPNDPPCNTETSNNDFSTILDVGDLFEQV